MRQARIFLFPSSFSAWPKTGVSKACKSRKSSKVTASPTSNPKSSFQPFNLPFLLSRKNLPPPPRSGDTMRGRKGGHLADEAETRETHRLGNSPGLSSFPPTYPDIPSQFLTVNQPSSTSSTVFPEVVWRRNKSCRFTERGGGKEREKNNRRQTIQREAFVRDNNHPFCSPSSSPPWLEWLESPAETAVIFGSHCPKVRGISSLRRYVFAKFWKHVGTRLIFERFDWNVSSLSVKRQGMGKRRNETIVLFFSSDFDGKSTSGKVWRCDVRGDINERGELNWMIVNEEEWKKFWRIFPRGMECLEYNIRDN